MQKIPWDVPERVKAGMEVFIGMMWVRTALVFPPQSLSLLHLPTWKNTWLIQMTAERRWKRALIHGRCAVGTIDGCGSARRVSWVDYNAACEQKVG